MYLLRSITLNSNFIPDQRIWKKKRNYYVLLSKTWLEEHERKWEIGNCQCADALDDTYKIRKCQNILTLRGNFVMFLSGKKVFAYYWDEKTLDVKV